MSSVVIPTVKVKTVADVPTLKAARGDLAVVTPTINAGHPNEAAMAAAHNAAQTAYTIGMQNDFVNQANALATTKHWTPG